MLLYHAIIFVPGMFQTMNSPIRFWLIHKSLCTLFNVSLQVKFSAMFFHPRAQFSIRIVTQNIFRCQIDSSDSGQYFLFYTSPFLITANISRYWFYNKSNKLLDNAGKISTWPGSPSSKCILCCDPDWELRIVPRGGRRSDSIHLKCERLQNAAAAPPKLKRKYCK